MSENRRMPPLALQILLGMALGAAVGVYFGKDAKALGDLGKLVIDLIKTVAAPLLFFAIIEAVITAHIRWRDGLRMALIATCNASVALAIGLTLSNLIQPGRHLSPDAIGGAKPAAAIAQQPIDLLKTLDSFVPKSWVQPFAENLILSLVLIALLIGFAIRRVRAEQQAAGQNGYRIVEDSVSTVLRMLTVILGWIIALVPLAVFGVVAKAVGEFGFAPIQGLVWYVGVALLGMALHILIVHQSWIFFSRFRLRDFWRHARVPAVYAFGANSSLATLPVTLTTLDRLGVSRSASRLGACVGTNLNNDGIILYEGMAVFLVAQASGMALDLPHQISAAFACMVAAVGVAGVPEAGFVSLALVLATVGLPVELLPLLLTVDWIIARARSVTNVLSDMVVSIALDRFQGAEEAR